MIIIDIRNGGVDFIILLGTFLSGIMAENGTEKNIEYHSIVLLILQFRQVGWNVFFFHQIFIAAVGLIDDHKIN